MKFVIEVAGKPVLFDARQLEQLLDLLGGTEKLEDKYVGSNNGTKGSRKDYLPTIHPVNVTEDITLKVMQDADIEAIKFVQKQQEQ